VPRITATQQHRAVTKAGIDEMTVAGHRVSQRAADSQPGDQLLLQGFQPGHFFQRLFKQRLLIQASAVAATERFVQWARSRLTAATTIRTAATPATA